MLCGGILRADSVVSEREQLLLEAAEPLNLPAEFVERSRLRAVMDAYAAEFHKVANPITSTAVQPTAVYAPGEQKLKRARARLTPQVIGYRRSLEAPMVPMRGFRAPVLDEAATLRNAALDRASLSGNEKKAAEYIHDRLAYDGLLLTLVEVIRILGSDNYLQSQEAELQNLSKLGFPSDLLNYFFAPNDRSGAELVSFVARAIHEGKKIEDALAAVKFRFRPTEPSFRGAAENGEHAIGLVRMQVGGGYVNGILPGGSINVTGQLVSVLPEADFLVSVPDHFHSELLWLAVRVWPLQRPDRLTLVPERTEVSPWAQDNGKAGTIASGKNRAAATLIPRFASQDEVPSKFYSAESFLMDGVHAAGHPVFHSPLLFPGGNLLVVRDPAKNERVLLLSQTELYRNTPLGLSRDEVLEAFKIEFGVDRCVPMPVVSYHLDYDVTLRAHEGGIVAFVNDGVAAARMMIELGLSALEGQKVLTAERARKARQQVQNNQARALHRDLHLILDSLQDEAGAYHDSLVKTFRAASSDNPTYNFQSFLAALDLFAASDRNSGDAGLDEVTANYFGALREVQRLTEMQKTRLTALGWKIVPVPSMPDLYKSINYLNGLQDKEQYLMPVVGGFYEELDRAAMGAFAEVLGNKIRIVPLLTGEIQRMHGGLHCVAAAYPEVEEVNLSSR